MDGDEEGALEGALEGACVGLSVGTIEGEVEGQKGKMALNVESISADKLTLALPAEELIAQVKEQMPEAMSMVPGEFDIDAMAKGTSMSMSFKR